MDNSEEECSICLGPFNAPKGLPCFHTFCLECLQMYIDQDTTTQGFFSCPMCRAQTKPSDSSKPPNEWAKLFPTNNYIRQESSQRQCPKHQEILDITCKTCNVLICDQCCLSTHEKCKKILTEISAKKIKNNLLARLDKMKVNLEPLENRLIKLEQNKELTEMKVKQMAKTLLDFIGNEENCWLQEIEAAHSKESGHLQEQKENLVQIMEMAQENIKDIDNLVDVQDTKYGPTSFSTFDYQPRHDLMTLKIDPIQSRQGNVDFQINQRFVNVMERLLKENMLDKIEIPALAKTPIADAGKVGATVDAVAMDYTEAASNLSEATAVKTTVVTNTPQVEAIPHPLQLKKLIDLGKNSLAGINDMVMLPDQCFLVTEGCFQKVWKFSTVGEKIQNLSFDAEPYGLCLLQNNLAAVSVPFNMKIVIFTTSDLKERDSISFQKKYHGLASDINERIFALYRTNDICVDVLSKRNPQSSYEISHVIKLATTIYFCQSYRLRVLPSGSIVIVTPSTVMNVSCIDQSGTVTFSYTGELKNRLTSIEDIAVDGNFIYIADKIGNNIHRIRHQGNFVDIPLTSNTGILNPIKIFHDQGDVLAVLSKTNNTKTYQIQLFSN